MRYLALLMFVAVAVAMAACQTTPTPTGTPDLSAAEVHQRMLDALLEVESYSASGTVHVDVEGEPDQDGSMTVEVAQDGFRMVTLSADSTQGSEFICLGEIGVARELPDGSWREQPRVDEQSCRRGVPGPSLPDPSGAIEVHAGEEDGRTVYIVNLRRVQDIPVTPEAGHGDVTSMTITGETTVDAQTFLPVRTTVHVEAPFTRWGAGENGADLVLEQSQDQSLTYDYDKPVDISLPEGFES